MTGRADRCLFREYRYMATKHLSAQISSRDIWMAGAELDMRDATEQEIAKACFLIGACGKTPERLKKS